MNFADLKYRTHPIVNIKLTNEENFICMYGLINCRMLQARGSNEILAILSEQMPDETLSEKQIEFINTISNQKVLVQLCSIHDARPDIFIYPENDMPFSVECFI